jgi:Flp pilus assembly protein TadB
VREFAFAQQLRASFLEARESVLARALSTRQLSTLSSFEQQLVRAEVAVSAPVYSAICITVGFSLFVLGLYLGPLFAVFIGVTVCYELLFMFPRERAFRRAQRAARQLPLLLETLGYQVRSGLSFESSLAKSLSQIPSGELSEMTGELVHKLGRGADLDDCLEELCDLCRLPDFRLFNQTVKMFGRGGRLHGDAFVDLAIFLRGYREKLSHLQGRAQAQRICFLVFTGLLVCGAAVGAHVVPQVLTPAPSSAQGLAREVGACAAVSMLLVAMRVTSAFSFEGHE